MKFFKNIIGLVVNNWWLKLIALFLAVIIFHTTKTSPSRNQNHPLNDRPIFQQF